MTQALLRPASSHSQGAAYSESHFSCGSRWEMEGALGPKDRLAAQCPTNFRAY